MDPGKRAGIARPGHSTGTVSFHSTAATGLRQIASAKGTDDRLSDRGL